MPGKNKKLGKSKENSPAPPTNGQTIEVNWRTFRRRPRYTERFDGKPGEVGAVKKEQQSFANNRWECLRRRRKQVFHKTVPQYDEVQEDEFDLSELSVDPLLSEEDDRSSRRRYGYDEYVYGYDPDVPGGYNPYAIYEALGCPIPPSPGFGGLTRFYGPFKGHVLPKYTHTWYYPYSMFHAGGYALYSVDQLLAYGREVCGEHEEEVRENDRWVGGARRSELRTVQTAPSEKTRWCKMGQHHVPLNTGRVSKSQIVKVGSFVPCEPLMRPLSCIRAPPSCGRVYVPAPPSRDFTCVDCAQATFWKSYYQHSRSQFGAPAEFVEPEHMVTVKLPMNLIAAMDDYLGIGRNGDIPWRLSGDMKRFRHLTTATANPLKQNAVLMGRKVWESIPPERRPLKDRFNVVLSTTMPLPMDGTYAVARSFPEALDLLNNMSDRIETIWNIGGYRVYEEGLRSEQLYQLALTYVEGNFAADVRFPPVVMHNFHKVENGEDNYGTVERGYRYRFETFQSVLWNE